MQEITQVPVGGPYECNGGGLIMVGEPEYCCNGGAGNPESPCGCMNLPINIEPCPGCAKCAEAQDAAAAAEVAS